MPEQIIVYSLPINKNNIQGRFYNVYLNKNSNLDLRSLVSNNKTNIQISQQPSPTTNILKDSVLTSKTITPNTQALNRSETLSLLLSDYNKLMQYSSTQKQIVDNLRKTMNDFITEYQKQDKLLESSLINQATLFQSISSSSISNRKGVR